MMVNRLQVLRSLLIARLLSSILVRLHKAITETLHLLLKNDDRSSLYHEASDKTQKLVELNLSKQDGTAKTIGERFDFQWTKQKPKKVEGKKS